MLKALPLLIWFAILRANIAKEASVMDLMKLASTRT